MKRHSAHVDANVLAELGAGLISGKRATRIHAHLAGCQQCARLSAGLTEIAALLASVPSPAMPESVTRQLQATLAQEAAERSARVTAPAQATSGDGSDHVLPFRSGPIRAGTVRGDTVRGNTVRGRRGFTGPVAARAFAAAAAACVVAAGGYTVAQLTSGGPAPSSGHSQAGAAAGPTASSRPAARPFIGLTPAIGSSGANVLSFKVINSGIDYQFATLSSQIKAELGHATALGPARSSGARFLHAPSTQQYACVMDVTGDIEPAMVDSARYNGRPATIIALAHVGNQLSQAWVVGPSCSADNPDVLTHVTLPTSGG
jgi:anti-sigma factor RsiW